MSILPAGTYQLDTQVVIEQDIYFSSYTGGDGYTDGNPDPSKRYYIDGAEVCGFPYYANTMMYVCKESRPIYYWQSTGRNGSSFTYDDKTVYYEAINLIGDTASGFSPGFMTNSFQPSNVGVDTYYKRVMWLMLYSDHVIPSGYKVTYDLENAIGNPNNPTSIPLSAVLTNMYFEPDTANGLFTFNSGSILIDGLAYGGGFVPYVWNPESGHLQISAIGSDIVIHVTAFGDPYQEIDGEEEITGGDTITIPPDPPVTTTSSGIIGLFAPTESQMRDLANFMWTDFGGTGTTVEDILSEIVQALKRSISNPLDYVIGLNIIPSQGLSIGSSKVIRFGFVSSGVSMPEITNQYFTVDCGSLTFDTLCGNTFLDYAPYSKFSIYLPYIGFKDVDANDFVGHTIGVKYKGDVVTGGLTAYITKDGSVMYQYAGCCALNIPLNSDSWGTTIGAAVQIATSVVASAATGGAAGVASSAVSGAASVAANPSLLSPQVLHSGAVSGSAGVTAIQTPFIIREAVRFHSTTGFNTVVGYPSYYYKRLSEVHGYTKVMDVHLHEVPATRGELDEIENLLKNGVIF